jgi:AraC-like DNA-binding protein
MKTITIQIKNMMCNSCVHVASQVLKKQNIEIIDIGLGYAILNAESKIDLSEVNEGLGWYDFELIRDQDEIFVNRIKTAVQDYLIKIGDIGSDQKLSEYLAKELAKNYFHLSKIFSQQTNETIEHYFIELKINKVKNLIKQGELNHSQIAYSLGYSSIQYLSNQFKKITGLSLSEYRKLWEMKMNLKPYSDTQVILDELIGDVPLDCAKGVTCARLNNNNRTNQIKVPVAA